MAAAVCCDRESSSLGERERKKSESCAWGGWYDVVVFKQRVRRRDGKRVDYVLERVVLCLG
jgi:hypothetical protein